MKVLCELPDLDKIIAEGKKRGFEIEMPQLTIRCYRVKITCDGQTGTAWIDHKENKKTTILDTGRWHKPRLRISIGKRVNVIGNRLSWKMKEFEQVSKQTSNDSLVFFEGEK